MNSENDQSFFKDEYPAKSFYKQSEVCSLTGVKPYVLRFWETEFDGLIPLSSSSGQKLYEYKHLLLVGKIKELLFDQKLTIEKARANLLNYSFEDILIEKGLSSDSEINHENLNSIPELPVVEATASKSDFDSVKLERAKGELDEIIKQLSEIKRRHQWSEGLTL